METKIVNEWTLICSIPREQLEHDYCHALDVIKKLQRSNDAMRYCLTTLLEVAPLIDNDEQHQTKAIRKAMDT